MKRPISTAAIIALLLAIPTASHSQNPFLPLWEHIPDGEPYVFDDPDKPGHKRVYLYGSHDALRTEYCGRDQVVWSASVDDLSNWRYDGIIFQSKKAADGSLLHDSGKGDVLYAPDVVEVTENGRKVYYLYPNNLEYGRQSMVAKSYRPDGPFEVCNWNADGRTTFGCLGFDPAVFQDDDGRIYGYWGFSHSHGAELDPTTMCSVKPGTEIKKEMVSSQEAEGDFRFYEASSMRKIQGKYVFIYSRVTKPGEFGLPASNYTLAYAYSDSPLGPFTYGGTLIDGRARDTDEQGRVICTATSKCNTHGSLAQINNQWYLFYHRHHDTTEYSRQAMVAPVDVKVEGGKVIISEAEYNSEGFATDGLNPLERQPAGIACYYTGPEGMQHNYPNTTFSGSYVKATYKDDEGLDGSMSLNYHHAPVVNNTAGSTIGYKYFNFDHLNGIDEAQLILCMKPHGIKGEIVIMTDSPWQSKGGKTVGSLQLSANDTTEKEYEINLSGLKGLKGKHALFMLFKSDTKRASLCDLYNFIFKKKE